MLKNKKIGFIGGGNMGEALIGGLINAEAVLPQNIYCSDIQKERTEFLHKTYGIHVTNNNLEVIRSTEILIYAIKPQIMAQVLKATADLLDKSKLIISIAAGIPLPAIEILLGKKLRLIRVMPNVAALIKEGASAITAGKYTQKEDIQVAMNIFTTVGKCVYLNEHHLMDAVTGLSGSGPAYIFIILDALADAGVKMGLSRQDALLLASQTVLGAAKLYLESGNHPGQLKDMVTSPAGTTISGLHALEKGRLRSTLMDAVEAATLRSKELGAKLIDNLKKSAS
jgi:pyrroline-5-carboxylate reductase